MSENRDRPSPCRGLGRSAHTGEEGSRVDVDDLANNGGCARASRANRVTAAKVRVPKRGRQIAALAGLACGVGLMFVTPAAMAATVSGQPVWAAPTAWKNVTISPDVTAGSTGLKIDYDTTNVRLERAQCVTAWTGGPGYGSGFVFSEGHKRFASGSAGLDPNQTSVRWTFSVPGAQITYTGVRCFGSTEPGTAMPTTASPLGSAPGGFSSAAAVVTSWTPSGDAFPLMCWGTFGNETCPAAERNPTPTPTPTPTPSATATAAAASVSPSPTATQTITVTAPAAAPTVQNVTLDESQWSVIIAYLGISTVATSAGLVYSWRRS